MKGYDTSSPSVMDTAHRSSRTPGGRARRSVLRHDQHASAPFLGCGTPVAQAASPRAAIPAIAVR